MSHNKITTVTRTSIADALTVGKLWYSGRLKEADFLNRIYDLSAMPSTDYRPEYNNAYKDVYQHADMNFGDWEPDWVFTDVRFNLMHCDDETYLKFLTETLNPNVRPDINDTNKVVGIYNKYLQPDGFQFYQTGELSGRPVFSWTRDGISQTRLVAKAVEIRKYIDTDYVNKKIEQMNKAIPNDTDVAIGTGKELLEIICKSILKQKNVDIDKGWTLQQLIKHTTNILDFKPKEADQPDAAERSIKQVLGGIATIVQGVTELRNAYGSGHGKDAEFKGLESKYAKLYVGVVAEIAIIYLATNGETVMVEPINPSIL
ncbi:hypothetical protein GCM10010967_57690 [Dyadobacter beijingensis]|uniref:Abortive infection Abi-like protein n=1 Tax=Dyadobacter beijingensis TaxID=365489 RepID=A0ABQ2IKT1_9BACT|nr:abortive infection family protein [Dyadobacter beijingensis]GGN13928.1 hypothetical protein GCM10010967_57690 [Dyadobacter beijingensis]